MTWLIACTCLLVLSLAYLALALARRIRAERQWGERQAHFDRIRKAAAEWHEFHGPRLARETMHGDSDCNEDYERPGA